jgi:hypothetical protein
MQFGRMVVVDLTRACGSNKQVNLYFSQKKSLGCYLYLVPPSTHVPCSCGVVG